MNKTRLEIKVGLFVFIGLLLLAVLLIEFSKGTSLFSGTYTLRLHAVNVGGLKLRAQVLLAGVQVGSVSDIKLAPDGKSVTIWLSVYKEYKIYRDARFVIEQAGFLGDQYVAIIPTENTGPLLANNDDVQCQEPFNLQEVARSAAKFISHIDEAAKKLDASIVDLRKTVLSEETLTNLSTAVFNMRSFSEQAVGAVSEINNLIETNGSQIGLAVSNVVYFSDELTGLAESAQSLLDTNSTQISIAVENVRHSTETLNAILDDVHAGKGLAGTLLQNQDVATNVAAIAENLSITTSNLNRLGLWRFLWHREPLHTNSAAKN